MNDAAAASPIPASPAAGLDTAATGVPTPAEPPPLRTFKLELAFDGTAYHGWQRQPDQLTVQQVLEEKLTRLFAGAFIRVQGSSRTDAGVHALGMAASFRAPESPYIPDWKVRQALNRLLPPDIRIRTAEIVPEGFNARFSAQGKSYVYVVNTGDPNPFVNRYSWAMDDMTHLDELRAALALLQGTHDFSSFTVERSAIDDPVRQLYRTDLVTFGPLVCLYFLGDGFLYKMVRSLVGTLMFVGRGRLPPDQFRVILEARDRLAAKDTAPAQGLFLKKVFYRHQEWLSDTVEEVPFRTVQL